MILLGAAAALLLGSTPSVGVISVGNDPALAGALQRSLEVRLGGTSGLHAVGAADIAPALGVKAPPPIAPDPVAQKKAADLIDAASRDYYQDKLVDALDKLATAAAIQERTPHIPTSERVRLLLWRTSVFLGLNDSEKAQAEARAALVLAPQLAVDQSTFKPSVAKLVDDVRGRGLQNAILLLEGVPQGAEVTIDDRPVTGDRVTVPIGKHRLVVRAPGFHEFERTVDVAGDSALPIAAPLALDPGLERFLVSIAQRGDVAPTDLPNLQKLADRLSVDALLIAAVRGEPSSDARTVLWWSGRVATASAPAAATPDGFATISDWASRTVATYSRTPQSAIVPVATPVPTPVARRRDNGPAMATVIAADGGLAIVDSTRNLKGTVTTGPNAGASAGYSSGFVGVGPRIAVKVTHGVVIGSAEVQYISYAVSRLNANLPTPGAPRETVDGGSTFSLRAAVGAEKTFGDPDAGPSVGATVGVLSESHTGNDLNDPSTGKVGIFPSESVFAVEIAARGGIGIGAIGGGPARLEAGLGVAPSSSYSEKPSGTSGTSPKTGVWPSWRLGARWTPASSWKVGFEYRGELRPVTFSDTGTSNLQLADTKLTDTLHTFAFTVQRSF